MFKGTDLEGQVWAVGAVETFTLLVFAGPHKVEQTVNAYSRTDGDLTLYRVTVKPDATGRNRYDGVAFFPKGQWHGIVKVQGEAREIEAPRKIAFQPPE